MSEADLRAGYARRGDHLRRLLLEREERQYARMLLAASVGSIGEYQDVRPFTVKISGWYK